MVEMSVWTRQPHQRSQDLPHTGGNNPGGNACQYPESEEIKETWSKLVMHFQMSHLFVLVF